MITHQFLPYGTTGHVALCAAWPESFYRLAARAEGLGMGWVSLFCPVQLAQLLGMPEGSKPIAVLCLGPVHAFYDKPMLQSENWARRNRLEDLIFEDGWGKLSSTEGST